MLDRIIALSLNNRMVVLAIALLVMAGGLYRLRTMPVDVFPDLNRPTVTVMTEAAGLAPEEVESLVTRPLEYLLNGATGVQRIRSASGIGLSIVWVEFAWGSDIYRDRQIVSEKLQLARERMPEGAEPVLAPVSSLMGEIMLLGIRTTAPATTDEERRRQAIELRTLAEFTIRNRLLAVEGVSQVTVMGGLLRQLQVLTSPARLAAQDVSLQELTEASRRASQIAGGGVLLDQTRESLIRINGQGLTPEDIAAAVVKWREPRSVLVRDVADVVYGGPVPRGDGGVLIRENGTVTGGPAVIVSVQKQPDVNTLLLDPALDRALDQLESQLPQGVRIERQVFRQADFIETAVRNVIEAVRDGTIWVVLILFLFLWNLRTSVITLTAIPLSLMMTVLILDWLGITINTMTLGGLAVAIGELVDDSIVDVENIYRRLKENRQRTPPLNPLRVIWKASSEIRNSIVYATLIVVVVVFPLFWLAGLEGRMFAPLGLAYLITLVCSLAVSLTVTPVLASFLLPRAKSLEDPRDSLIVRGLKWVDRLFLRWMLRHAWIAVLATLVAAIGANWMVLHMGSEFLPPFNEGTLTINLQTQPGTSLEESVRIARRAESMILEVPEVLSVARRTGRAELDEHAEGVNSSDLEVRLAGHLRPKPGWWPAVLRALPVLHGFGIERSGRSREEATADIRERITNLPNVAVNIGQPVSHRLDHIMTGVRAQIVLKVFGEDLREIRDVAHEVEEAIHEIPGVVDLQIEPQVEIPQLQLRVRREELGRYGLTAGEVVAMLETAFRGTTVAELVDGDRWFPLVVWFDEAARSDPATISQTILDTPSGRRISLGQVAEVRTTTGPNTLNREAAQRRIAVYCNVAGRDLGGVATEIQAAIQPVVATLSGRPGSPRIELGGQFEAQQSAAQTLLVLGCIAVLVVFLLLWKCLGSWPAAIQVLLVNLPLAALGSVVLLMAINRPEWEDLRATPWWQWPALWAEHTTLSLAHWIGFITLVGIVARNGIMMISHYLHLMRDEGEVFGEAMVIRGSLERLSPVMMTALTTIIGLVPLALGAGETGREILHPLAIVVIGGLLSSTLLDQLVTPAVFHLVGRTFGAEIYGSPADHDVSAG